MKKTLGYWDIYVRLSKALNESQDEYERLLKVYQWTDKDFEDAYQTRLEILADTQ